MSAKMSEFAVSSTLSSADKIPIVRGSGGVSQNLSVTYATLLTYLRNSINPVPDPITYTLVCSDASLATEIQGNFDVSTNTRYMEAGQGFASATATLPASANLAGGEWFEFVTPSAGQNSAFTLSADVSIAHPSGGGSGTYALAGGKRYLCIYSAPLSRWQIYF